MAGRRTTAARPDNRPFAVAPETPPDPPPDPASGDFVSYTEMRSTAGGSGQSKTLISAANPRFNGTFDWSATDPSGYGDARGTVISDGNGGWWIRRGWNTNTEANPIDLSWWDWFAGTKRDITSALRSLISDLASAGNNYTLHVKAPDVPGGQQLVVDTLDLRSGQTYQVKTFTFQEPDTNPCVLFHRGADVIPHNRTLAADIKYLFRFGGVNSVKIGSLIEKPRVAGASQMNLTLVGVHEGVSTRDLTASSDWGLIDCTQTTGTNVPFEVRCNIYDADGCSVNITGTTNNLGSHLVCKFGGDFLNGCLRVNSGAYSAHHEDTKVSDPYAAGAGWRGGTAATNDYANWGQKNRGAWNQRLHRLSGTITLEYGWSHMFIAGVTNIGNSTSDRFRISIKDIGFTGPRTPYGPTGHGVGVEHNHTGAIMQGWKTDPFRYTDLSQTGYDNYFIEHETQAGTYGSSPGLYGILAPWPLNPVDCFFQAERESPLNYITKYADLKLVTLRGTFHVATDVDGDGSVSSHHKISGTGIAGSYVIINTNDIVENYTGGCVATCRNLDTITKNSVNCIIRNSTIGAGDFIGVIAGTTNLSIQNVTFSGGTARKIGEIRASDASGAAITISMTGCTYPANSWYEIFGTAPTNLTISGQVSRNQSHISGGRITL